MENEEHPVYNALQEKIKLVEKELLTEEKSDTTQRSLLLWKDLLAYTNVVLNAKRFPNIPKSFLNELYNSLSVLNRNIIRDYPSYSSYYSNVLNQTKRIPVVEYRGDVKQSFTSMANQFEKQANRTIEEFKEERKSAMAEWKQEKTEWQQELQILQKEKENLTAELNTLKSDFASQKQQNQNLITNLQIKFNQFIEREQTKITELKEDFTSQLKNYDEEHKQEANEVLEHLQIRKEEVEKLWGIIGKAVVSGQAQSYADKAQKMANILMWTAFTILIGLTLGLVIITMFDIYQQKFSFLTFCYKVMASAVLLAPAIYCMNLAKRQRDREFQLRDFEVKTTALEPFLERMEFTSDDQKSAKDTVKLELAKAFFDTEFAKENKQHGAILLSADMIDGLAKLGDIFNSQRSEGK